MSTPLSSEVAVGRLRITGKIIALARIFINFEKGAGIKGELKGNEPGQNLKGDQYDY